MNYAELSVMQASRAKTFSAAQTDAMAAYCQAEHDLKELQAENAKLRVLVRNMFYAVHPVDREKFLTNVVELGVEVDA